MSIVSSNERFWDTSSGEHYSTWSDDQILLCGLDDIFGDNLCLVCHQDMFHLKHKPFNQANISSCNTQNSGDSLFISKIIGIRLDTMTPALLQKIARLVIGQGLHFMGESDSRIELWSAHETLFQARHPKQNQAELAAICKIAHQF